MSTETEARVVVGRPKSDDDLDHIVCCEDPDGSVSLCGLDVSASAWIDLPDDDPAGCVVCDDIWETSDECPRYGRCFVSDAHDEVRP